MKKIDGTIYLTASDLVGHISCGHLTSLDIQVANKSKSKPDHYDPLLEILRERGYRHEAAYIDYLKESGLEVVEIEEQSGITDTSVEQTLQAMQDGKPIIVQGALRYGCWNGKADILRKVDIPSNLGDWSYEVIDTKLSRETKGGTVLQLCLYANLLERIQGIAPEYIHVVAPWSDFEPQSFRYDDFAAYFRRALLSAEKATNEEQETYPEPKPHCDICRWNNECDKRRRDDDHLCFVANITKNQINELREHGIDTLEALASAPAPISFAPRKGSSAALEKTRLQAVIQNQARNEEELKYEYLELIADQGLARLPEPSIGDVFFDIESDQFVGEHGLEYLLGYSFDEGGKSVYKAEWALDKESEKGAFERFVDFIIARLETYPDMHIYHFAPYEPAALKRLMGRYATREEEVDNLLRGEVFVDLLSIVKNSVRASVESYSLKKLEPFYRFNRNISLHDANVALTQLSTGLELDDLPSITEEAKEAVQAYNTDDCFSTESLRDWLELLRTELVAQGNEISRPAIPAIEMSDELSEQILRVRLLIEQLTHGIPVDTDEHSDEQKALWLLANLLEWHRREAKAGWWEFFRLSDLIPEELIHEKPAISGLTLLETVDTTARGIPTHRYQFEPQDTDIRGGEAVKQNGGDSLGTVVQISPDECTMDIKKSKATADIHPDAVFAHQVIRTNEQEASLIRLAEYVIEHGLYADGSFKSSRELLLRAAPNLSDELIQQDGELTLDAALRLSRLLNGGVLPIQGPPGTGKSFTGAHMICSLVQQGNKVGITANSHKVIRNLLDKVIEVAGEKGMDVSCIQKPKEYEPDIDSLSFAKTNTVLFNAISTGDAQVAGATHFLWSREEAQDSLDVLFIDEAAQMSLANVLAVASSAPTLILLGDPQQLEQPMQGSHPDGADVSALDHIIGEQQTISTEQGLFLETTWRLHPEICSFNSELFYESKLESMPDCIQQNINSGGAIFGHGIRYLPIEHLGNTNSSIEEAELVEKVIEDILSNESTWTDRHGVEYLITLDDILIISPYNAQVFEIKKRLPDARVGTVDKFQGQEAPITIYSMATSSHEDAPRGMEFLYSLNRLNVAISRAKCLAIMIASPEVFNAECRTPRQMQLANAFCRYLEKAGVIMLG
jgi:uncharacterized protein